jgi:hypothetical protein
MECDNGYVTRDRHVGGSTRKDDLIIPPFATLTARLIIVKMQETRLWTIMP